VIVVSEKPKEPFTSSVVVFVVSVILMLVIGAWFLYSGYTAFVEGRSDSYYHATIGVVSVASAAYVAIQYKRRASKYKVEEPKVFTQLESEECGYKTRRIFLKGDYVFKKAESCPKCKKPMTITRIFREVKEK